MDINTTYDTILHTELEKRLKRTAHPSEVVNADNDSDLVTETLWQIICELNNRVQLLEQKK